MKKPVYHCPNCRTEYTTERDSSNERQPMSHCSNCGLYFGDHYNYVPVSKEIEINKRLETKK